MPADMAKLEQLGGVGDHSRSRSGRLFGGWNSPRAEEFTRDCLAATDPTEQTRIAQAIGDLAMEDVATLPSERFYVKTALRPTITGMQGPSLERSAA